MERMTYERHLDVFHRTVIIEYEFFSHEKRTVAGN
jgi:hypothetical protein